MSCAVSRKALLFHKRSSSKLEGEKNKKEKEKEKGQRASTKFPETKIFKRKTNTIWPPMFQFFFRGLRTVTFVILKLPEQLYSPCCRSAVSSLPTLSLRMPRMMLKHYNNKALEGGSIQLREKCEEWNTETNNCPIGLCSLLVPPEVQRLPQQGSLHGKSNLWDAS